MSFLDDFFGGKLNGKIQAPDETFEKLINDPEDELKTNVILQSLLETGTNLLRTDAKSSPKKNQTCSNNEPAVKTDGTIEQMKSKNVIEVQPLKSSAGTQLQKTESIPNSRAEIKPKNDDNAPRRTRKRERFRTCG